MAHGLSMTNPAVERILSRSATKYDDPGPGLSDDQIREPVWVGTPALTSFHLQNLRFVTIRSAEAKARLRPITWDQPAITEPFVSRVAGQRAGSRLIIAKAAN